MKYADRTINTINIAQHKLKGCCSEDIHNLKEDTKYANTKKKSKEFDPSAMYKYLPYTECLHNLTHIHGN